MRFAIVYFSHSGNNRLLAENLAQRLDCELLPVVEEGRRNALTIMFDMLLARTPAIKPLPRMLANFDHIILIAPIWGGKLAHPMKALVKREQAALSSYSFISLCGQGRPGQVEDIRQELAELVGRAPHTVAELGVAELFPKEKRKHAATISAYRATRSDLDAFAPQIDAFLDRIAPERAAAPLPSTMPARPDRPAQPSV